MNKKYLLVNQDISKTLDNLKVPLETKNKFDIKILITFAIQIIISLKWLSISLL